MAEDVSSHNGPDNGIKAIVFDLDGTIINTTVDFRKMKEQLLRDLIKKRVPSSLLDPKDTIVNNLSRLGAFLRSEGRAAELTEIQVQVAEMMNRVELERVQETTSIPGASEALLDLKHKGYRLGLLTRGSRVYAVEALRFAGIKVGFDTMICRDDFPEDEAKPNGLAMRRMASSLGFKVDECLLVGDHLIDLNCARSSSSRFLGVLSGSFKWEDWSRCDCADVIESVAFLPTYLTVDK